MSDRPILVFDVNETLLDLNYVEPVFDRLFGEAWPREIPIEGGPSDVTAEQD